MSKELEYWIGENINFDEIWRAYDAGKGYIDKYHSMEVHLIEIEFETPTNNLPLFSHEAIFKTLKGYFHELKLLCLSNHDYNVAGPLFFYEVSRGSAKWSFLGELRQLLLFGSTLSDEKLIGQSIDNIDKKLTLLKNHFGPETINPDDFKAFMNAKTPVELEKAVNKILEHKIKSVKISKKPFKGEIEDARGSLVDLKNK